MLVEHLFQSLVISELLGFILFTDCSEESGFGDLPSVLLANRSVHWIDFFVKLFELKGALLVFIKKLEQAFAIVFIHPKTELIFNPVNEFFTVDGAFPLSVYHIEHFFWLLSKFSHFPADQVEHEFFFLVIQGHQFLQYMVPCLSVSFKKCSQLIQYINKRHFLSNLNQLLILNRLPFFCGFLLLLWQHLYSSLVNFKTFVEVSIDFD